MKNKRIKNFLFLGISLLISSYMFGQVPQGGKKISSDLLGLFFEDINYAADGGLYAELIQNRSFEYNPNERGDWNPFSYWDFIKPGFSIGYISVETKEPVHPNNPHYVVINADVVGNYEQAKEEAGVGLKNSGFDGIVVQKGENYKFSVFSQLLSSEPIKLIVKLQSNSGDLLGRSELLISDTEWQKYSIDINVTDDSDSASFVILMKSSGTIALDMVSLFPEKTFKNRANGLRADLAQTLADMHPKFIRFPGGCLVHGDGLKSMYRWKNTIGPLEQRVEQRNIWGYHQTLGLGYYEYFQFCEDIGAKPVPVVPAAVSCQNSGGTWRIGGKGQQAMPEAEIDDYIQELLDLIEWANGSINSEWGAKRATAGHPESFNLKCIGIGNEDKITPEFEERFSVIYNAIKEKYPEITVIGTSGPFHSGEDYDKGWDIARNLKVPIVDEHYYVQPEWFIANQNRYDAYDRNGGEVYLGEYASWGNKLWNAIAEAAYMTALERNGDVVRMASYAPMLAKKGFTQWSTDMIFFDNKKIVLTPNFYVQKMFMTNQGDYYFNNVFEKQNVDSTLAASCVVDSKTGDVILKIVNVSQFEKSIDFDLSQFKSLSLKAKLTQLSGNKEFENSFDNSRVILPIQSEIVVKEKQQYQVPSMSLTILRFQNK